MKHKLHQTSQKYLVVPLFAIGLMAVLAFAAAENVAAYGGKSKNELAEVIADKFNLDQEKVVEVMQEFHQKKGDPSEQKRRSQRLTDAQRYTILEKFEEMHERMAELYDQDLSKEDLRELRSDIHEEMQDWAVGQGIDFELFMRTGKKMMFERGQRW